MLRIRQSKPVVQSASSFTDLRVDHISHVVCPLRVVYLFRSHVHNHCSIHTKTRIRVDSTLAVPLSSLHWRWFCFGKSCDVRVGSRRGHPAEDGDEFRIPPHDFSSVTAPPAHYTRPPPLSSQLTGRLTDALSFHSIRAGRLWGSGCEVTEQRGGDGGGGAAEFSCDRMAARHLLH